MKNESAQEKEIISTKMLSELAIYLEGINHGKGNLLPLGTEHLEQLWKTIKFLRGDVRYTCPEMDD
jgi:hypothetical protein